MKEYFSHDYNARSDKKIKCLIQQHGLLGYGVYWAIVEDLYMNNNSLPTDYKMMAFEYRSDEEIIRSILNDFGLFVVKEKKFFSKSVQKRIDERNHKSSVKRDAAKKRWDAYALQQQSTSNAIKEKKRKENKSKDIEGEMSSAKPQTPKPKVDIENRMREWGSTLAVYVEEYGHDMVAAFYKHWSEPNKSRTKMKWEMQSTWDVKRRLDRWRDNDDKWNKPAVNKSDEQPGLSAATKDLLNKLGNDSKH